MTNAVNPAARHEKLVAARVLIRSPGHQTQTDLRNACDVLTAFGDALDQTQARALRKALLDFDDSLARIADADPHPVMPTLEARYAKLVAARALVRSPDHQTRAALRNACEVLIHFGDPLDYTLARELQTAIGNFDVSAARIAGADHGFGPRGTHRTPKAKPLDTDTLDTGLGQYRIAAKPPSYWPPFWWFFPGLLCGLIIWGSVFLLLFS